MSKSMIDKHDEIDLEVSHADQKMINTFGRLNNRKHELLRQKKFKQEDLEKATDAQDDVFLADDETKFKYMMGEAYIETEKSETEELIEKYMAQLEEDIKKIDEEIEDIAEVHKELKVHLYAKFKTSINLEE
ncbi:prefoldin beta-like domain containing protein [Cavenderia fasciculata]|uniref:Prefoldin subunit 4 n=1 Tax=Cavenderia fasciculata TaxID=261658 RepID=F4Q8M7_CACFS|nr:prefoldin beta-like domain containing protein [Cavenderia fasciculata]EGG15046.1 prefoldin beta-like domain containing protein [Cavenderia fasciculata]|eukprot:XP_004351766.1 prefoldin beta-like domain containing protein [Cavenderia fasciculata]